MKKVFGQQLSWFEAFLLVAGFIGGVLGGLVGITVARMWLDQISVQQAWSEVVRKEMWMATFGSGVGGSLGVWWGWRLMRSTTASSDRDNN
ncbi:MAG: hypothetical protein WHS44_08885 [Fimbriimonadales bacterium]